jgi:hypothetical protein
MSDRDFKIVSTMEKYGGHFAKAIAVAASRADSDNLARLKAAFPEMWQKYAELAELAADR